MATYLLGAIVRLWGRLAKGGINKEERRRQRSIAAASTPLHGEILSPEDQELVDAHHEIVVEWRTDAHPIVGLDDPLHASPLDTYWRLPAVSLEATPLYYDTVLAMAEPEPWEEMSFTQDIWNVARLQAAVAEAKAANAR